MRSLFTYPIITIITFYIRLIRTIQLNGSLKIRQTMPNLFDFVHLLGIVDHNNICV